MKTCFEFRSSKFPPYDGEEEETNPGLWGKRLAEHLVTNLAAHGLTAGEPIAEDWGWYSSVICNGRHYMLGASASDEESGEREWVLQIVKQRSLVENGLPQPDVPGHVPVAVDETRAEADRDDDHPDDENDVEQRGAGSPAHPITPKARTRRRYSGYSGKAAASTPSS